MFFPYKVEPLRPALILIAVEVVILILVPGAARGFVLLWLSGPLVWLLLQQARRNAGVRIESDHLELQSAVTRRVTTIPLAQVQAYWLMSRGALALAYAQPRPAAPGDPDPRPPRVRLYVTAAVADQKVLAANLPAAHGMTTADLQKRLRARQTRRIFIVIFLIAIAFPLTILIALRFLFSLGFTLAL